jgi:hypothetical protein
MKSVIAYVRTILFCVVCATVVAAVMPSSGEWQLLNDKLVHGSAFFVIAVLAAFAFPSSNLVWVAAGAAALGGGIELLQGLGTATRHGDVLDFMADVAGVTTGLVPLALTRLRLRFAAASGMG